MILASQSIGRQQLFEQTFGKGNFEVRVSEVDEEGVKSQVSDPHELTRRLAVLKAAAVGQNVSDGVFGFDTVVVCEGNLLGKPATKEEAKIMLAFLGGKEQQVISGWAFIYMSKGVFQSGAETTHLFFHPMTTQEIDSYVAQHPVTRFAGGYGVQDKDDLVEILSGRMDTVIGAPMNRVVEAWENAGE